MSPVPSVYQMIPNRAPCLECGKRTALFREHYPSMGSLAFICAECQIRLSDNRNNPLRKAER